MRLVILGPGALGSVLGAALTRAGEDVVLVGRPSPHLSALRANGLFLTTPKSTGSQIRLKATADPSAAAGAEAIIVLVKAGDTEDAMKSIAPYVGPGQSVLTLQNGLGNAERIRQVLGSGPKIFPGTTSQAATRLGPGEVTHSGEGLTRLGVADESDSLAAENIARVFRGAGWPTETTSDIERWLWRKAAINAAINGLTAIGGFRNGVIAADPELLSSAESIAEEAAAIARAKGFDLGDMRQAVWETAVATADNASSMLQDMEAGRRTEVDAIHGAILAVGEETGIAAPALRLTAALIKARERQYRRLNEADD